MKSTTTNTKIERKNGKVYINDQNEGLLEVKYGLPPEVKYCINCVISNQRVAPSIVTQDTRNSEKSTVPFAEDGLCEPCRIVLKKQSTNWEERELQLKVLLDKYRSNDGRYDCLIPGSGGKDSVYASHILKTKYGMHPLTVTWAPHMYTDVGWRNFQSWVKKGGADNYLFSADGITQRKLTELSYRNLLHPFQPFTLGQRNFPIKFAMQMGIKLMFYGENAAEYGSGLGEDETSLVPERFYTCEEDSDIHISGLNIEELKSHGVEYDQLSPYLPVNVKDVKKSNIEVHYLGHFLKWIPQECYYYAVEATGFEANPDRTEGTYSKYNSIDDKIDGFHYWTGHIKFGIGRCTHEASQEIRHGHITREEGIALVQRFDGEFPKKYFQEFLDYINIDEEEFHKISDGFRSPHLWKKTSGGWELRHKLK